MNDVRETINTMLVKTFHEILELEEKAIITDEFSDISNSLVNKGYVARARSEKDRRVVNVYLLEKGIAAYKHHEEFHEKMLDAIMETLSPEELVVWAKSCDRLTQFLKSYDKSHIKKAK